MKFCLYYINVIQSILADSLQLQLLSIMFTHEKFYCDIQKFSFIILSFLNKNQIRYFYIRIQDYFISPLFSISFSIYINIIVLTSTFPISTAVSDFDRTPLICFRIIIDIDSLSNIRYLSLFVYILYS